MVPGLHKKKDGPKPDEPNLSVASGGPAEEEDGQQLERETKVNYKAKLDSVAEEYHFSSSTAESNQQGSSNGGSGLLPVVEQVYEYISFVGTMLGQKDSKAADDTTGPEEGEQSASKDDEPEPEPRRPDHDTQIECFIRDQHRSLHNGRLQ